MSTSEVLGKDMTFTPEVGQLYRITVGGRLLANLYRYEGDRPHHCQLHGDYIGQQWEFRKRRNSDVHPWGSLSRFDPDSISIEKARGESHESK